MIVQRWTGWACTAGLLVLLQGTASAQIAPSRTIDELKAETQARADRNAYPLTGLKPTEVREALSNIRTLDRDEWAAAWSVIAERYVEQAKAAEAAGQHKEASENYLNAWRVFSFAPLADDQLAGQAEGL